MPGFFDLNGTAEYHIRKLYDHVAQLGGALDSKRSVSGLVGLGP